MQRPTCEGIRVRSTADAHIIFHAVALKKLPMIMRRLDTEERRQIRSGCVYVWEERSPNADVGGVVGIERWTDSKSWGPSRVKDDFLYYHERDRSPGDSDTTLSSQPTYQNLVKQTYSVLVQMPSQPIRKKWHLTAYFTHDTLNDLRTVDDIPLLATLYIPPERYISARSVSRSVMRPMCGYAMSNFTGLEKVRTVVTIDDRPPLWGWDYQADGRATLAPLMYLEKIAPARRHPMDEKALMSFSCHFALDVNRGLW